jgi:hypothetical protein
MPERNFPVKTTAPGCGDIVVDVIERYKVER